MNPKISVIIPVYNTEAYLEKTLDSVRNQTLRDIEILCVDDGSTDSSGRILSELAVRDARIKVIHKPNGGVTAARRDGILAATGDFIGFADSDDYLEPTMYERLWDNAQKTGAEISHCGYRMVSLSGEVKYFYNTGRMTEQNTAEGLNDLLTGAMEPALCNKIYKRELVQALFQSGRMDLSLKINEDLLMNYYLFRAAGHSVFEDICPYYYIKRENSASTSKINRSRVEDPLTVKQRILEDCIGTKEEKTARLALLSTCQHIYNDILADPEKQFYGKREEIRAVIRENKDYIKELSKKQRFLTGMILSCPALYRILFALYQQKKGRNP